MRDIKFRAWNKEEKKMYFWDKEPYLSFFIGDYGDILSNAFMEANADEFMQYTGLKDKNGKEIYEFMELDNKWEVDWLNGKYILRDISNGDIIDLDYENEYEITREYTKV